MSARHVRRICRHGIVLSSCRCIGLKTDVIVACGARCTSQRNGSAPTDAYVPQHAVGDDAPADESESQP